MPRDLAALLVESGATSPEDLERALARQREMGGTLDTAVLELGLVPERELVELLARSSELPAAPAEGIEPDPRARRVFPARVAERHGLVPYKLEGRELSLLAVCPVDLAAVDEIAFMLSLHLVPHASPEWRVRELMARTYGGELPQRLAALAEASRAPAAPERPQLAPPPPEPAPRAARSAVEEVDLDFSIDEDVAPEGVSRRDGPAAPPTTAHPSPAVAAAVPQLPEDDVPRWSREEAFAALDAARTRDEVVSVALRYTRSFLEAAAMFALTRDQVIGRDALGWEGARARCRAIHVPLEQTALFRAVVETGGPFLGPIAAEPGNEAILAALGRPWPRTALVCPVLLHDRIVCILYADNGDAPVTPRRLGDLFLLVGALGSSFERILREKRVRPEAPASGGSRSERDGLGEELAAGAAGEDSPLPGPAAAAEELVSRLAATRRGSTQREQLIGALAHRGPEAAAALRAAFPGPLDAAEDAASLPPDQRGPILAGMAGLGAVATPYLVDLLGEADAGPRRWAALLLGRLRDPAAFLPLAERVLDRDPGAGEAALAALSGVRQHPDFQPVLERLRRALLGCDSDRPAQAARALARLGDAGAIPLLIEALESPEPLGGAAAAALEALTCRRFGRDASRWISWWRDHRSQRRADWLFAALEDEDGEVRLAAAEALREAAPAA